MGRVRLDDPADAGDEARLFAAGRATAVEEGPELLAIASRMGILGPAAADDQPGPVSLFH